MSTVLKVGTRQSVAFISLDVCQRLGMSIKDEYGRQYVVSYRLRLRVVAFVKMRSFTGGKCLAVDL